MFIFVLLQSCQKTDSLSLPSNSDTDFVFQSRVNNEVIDLVADSNFVKLIEVDQAILNFTDTVYNAWWSANRIDSINEWFNNVDSEGLPSLLEEIGVPNSEDLVALFYEKIDITSDLVQNTVFMGKSITEAGTLFDNAFEYYLELNPELERGGECGRSLQNDRKACDKSFTKSTAITVLTAVGATIFGTPAAGGGVLAIGIGDAYFEHKICMSHALEAYHICIGLYSKEDIEGLPYIQVGIPDYILDEEQ